MYGYYKSVYRSFAQIIIFSFVLQSAFLVPLSVQAQVTDPEADISTGDAYAESLSETQVNTNVIDASTDPDLAEPENQTASTSDVEEVGTDLINVLASSTNSATIDTNATTSASTGDNTAVGETATIVTGDGYAVANVVNLANTNIQNSNGLIDFLTSLGVSTLDVRSFFDVFNTTMPVSTAVCNLDSCSDYGVVYQSQSSSSATISNSVVVRAQTGDNSITADGDASITTGDAYAAANIFNIANTNITDSNYLLVSINNLGSLSDDIVLPAAHLLDSLFGKSALLGSGQTVVNDNVANLDTTVTTLAETGNNESTGGSIETGEAVSSGNVTNTVNQNLVGIDSFFLLIRVHGNWSGDIMGLPSSMRWAETPQGITVYTADDQNGNGTGSALSQAVSNTNTASIRNNVSVFALTGSNKIETEGESAIKTGNAYASASIINLANLNILSQNWALLLFDIFGDWDGNISFGRPDLWVGAQATSPSAPIMPGSDIDYTFTVSNLGDTTAHQVKLNTQFNPNHLQLPSGSGVLQGDGSALMSIPIGTLEPGATKEIVTRVRVSDSVARRNITLLPLSATVSGKESEDNMSNNTDSITVEAGKARRSSSGRSIQLSTSADMIVEKTANVSTSTVPVMVDYQITLENTGGTLYNAVLFDTLVNETGDLLHKEYWELGSIASGEIVTVTYSTHFGTTTEFGLYKNTAEVVGNHQTSIPNGKNTYTASSTVVVELAEKVQLPGMVLGVATSTCEQYLKSYLRYGELNPETEVQKLKVFLSKHLGIPLPQNDSFDLETLAAVKNFQAKYAQEILRPWGMLVPSGYVYLTTRRMINELQCNELGMLPLTEVENTELGLYD